MSRGDRRKLARQHRVGLLHLAANFRNDLMVAIVDDRQRGLRGCTIVVGETSLHGKQQPTRAHEPSTERLDGVTLLTINRGDSYSKAFAPPDEATPWRPLSSDTVPDTY